MTVLVIVAGWLALMGCVCAFMAGCAYLDEIEEDRDDETNRSFPAPSSEGGGERGGGVVPRVARPERRGTPPPIDKWMLIAQGMKARLR